MVNYAPLQRSQWMEYNEVKLFINFAKPNDKKKLMFFFKFGQKHYFNTLCAHLLVKCFYPNLMNR